MFVDISAAKVHWKIMISFLGNICCNTSDENPNKMKFGRNIKTLHGNNEMIFKDRSPNSVYPRSKFEKELNRRMEQIEEKIENIHKLLR